MTYRSKETGAKHCVVHDGANPTVICQCCGDYQCYPPDIPIERAVEDWFRRHPVCNIYATVMWPWSEYRVH